MTKRDRKRVRLASPNQLWVLNRSGWLELRTTPVMDRLTSERAVPGDSALNEA